MSPLAVHIANLSEPRARRVRVGPWIAPAVVLTGLAMMAYAWFAFYGLIPWWSA